MSVPDETSAVSAPTPRVLIVEDDPISRVVLVQAVTNIGCEPVEATCISEAIDQVRRGLCSVIILDAHLPDGCGTAVAQFARASLRCADIPIIAVSADDRPEFVAALLAAGADRFVSKPVSAPALCRLLESMVLSGG